MKTKILFMLLLFFINLCFGQEKWIGEWTQMDCFRGIYYKVGSSKYGNKGDYQWWIKFKSTYNKKVHFNYSWDLSGDAFEENGPNNRITIQSNSEISNSGTERFTKNSREHWIVKINNVCFGETAFNCGNSSSRDMCYADCDNGTPNIPTNCNNKGSNNHNGNNNLENAQNSNNISQSNSNSKNYNNYNNPSINNSQQAEIYETVDEIPNFPGGINAFRQKAAANFDTSDIAGSGKAKTEVTFLVEKDGTISNIQASGNNLQLNDAASRAVSLVKEKWTPAKLNGNIVKYRFRIPFAIDLESEVATNNKPNQQNGTTVRYEGDYKIETIFNSGKVTEVKATNTKTGKLIIHQFYDENEKPKEVITYYENGNKRSHAYFIDGKINSYKENDGHGNFIEKPIPQ
ncbi:MAG: hypothetical protein E2590_00595 [Chryseobacterium sp.]|nr:hypothetical protein [Chryseobacterium sp.]